MNLQKLADVVEEGPKTKQESLKRQKYVTGGTKVAAAGRRAGEGEPGGLHEANKTQDCTTEG